jgi:spoIIIJ-associated protein
VSEKKYSVATVGERLDAFLRGIVKNGRFRLGFEITDGGVPHPEIENPEVMVKFSGPDVELLLANKAELLLALEQLAMELLRMAPEEHSCLCFDANDYRLLRIEELRLSAMTAAERVKQTRTPFHFNPMNSRERRILHLALRDDRDVHSESDGMGPQRHVVIYPANMPAKPLGPAAPAFRRRRR